jgi:hypothetical protein
MRTTVTTARELIESSVPTILNERGHVWRRTTLFGCEKCSGAHDGFACCTCYRVVDYLLDPELFAAIVEIGYLPEVFDEDDS